MSDESEICSLIERWVKAIQARDIDRVAADHTDDIVMFDVPPPVAVRGIAAYRETWPQFFDWQKSANGTFEIVTLDVTAGTDVAFATAVLRCGSREDLAKDPTPQLRLTIGLRKVADRWMIAHEHHSFPAT